MRLSLFVMFRGVGRESLADLDKQEEQYPRSNHIEYRKSVFARLAHNHQPFFPRR